MKNRNGKLVRILFDKDNRIITKPYTKDNLNDMSLKLGIKKCWFEKGGYYTIPHFKAEAIKKSGKEVNSKVIDALIK